MQPLRVYLSSTYEDLKDHRDAVSLALTRSGLTVSRMEAYVASDQRPLDMCLKDVAQCDVFVGIYAWRYGYEPPAAHGNPDTCSITHLEYQKAEDSGLRKLLFFAHPETREHWPKAFRDDVTGQGDNGAKLARFRQTVGNEKTVSFFRTLGELATLVLAAIMRSGLPGRVYNVPPLPPGVSARANLVDATLAGLVGPGQQPGRNTLIQGAGGFGKTTLALLTCHRPEVVQAYPDGLLWASLGEAPALGRVLGDLHVLVTGNPVAVVGVDAIAGALAKALHGRKCLVVVDDVWREEDLAPFARLSGPRLLVTTRSRVLVQQSAQQPWPEVPVDEMSVDEAGAMLGRGLVLDAPTEAALRDLAQRLGCWPLLLDLAAARLREEHKRGRGTLAHCLAFVSTLFEKKGVLGFDRRDSQARNAAVARSVDVGLELADQIYPEAALPARAAELSVFPENLAIPMQVLVDLWGIDEFDLEEEVVRPLDHISLLRWNRQAGTVSMHMMIHRVLDARLKANARGAAAVHRRLLAAWGDPLHLPHPHAWRWLGWHCMQAGDGPRLRALLLDMDWIRARIGAATKTHDGQSQTDMTEVLRDYALFATDDAVVEVGRALRASELLRMHPALLCQQLHGRLQGSSLAPSQALARAALEQIARSEALVPAWAGLEPPAAVLAICRNVHDTQTGDPVLLLDGRRALVSRPDGTSMLLDITDDFHLIRKIELPATIEQVLLLPDSRHVLYLCQSSGNGACMEVWRWDLEHGGDPQVISRWDWSEGWMFRVAPGNRRALITAHDAGLIALVDLENDCKSIALSAEFGQAEEMFEVEFSPSGRRAILFGEGPTKTQLIDVERGGHAICLTPRPQRQLPQDWTTQEDAPIDRVAFGANEDLAILTLHGSEDVYLWRFGQTTVPLPTAGSTCWALPMPDGCHALTCGYDRGTETYSLFVLSPRQDDQTPSPGEWEWPRCLATLHDLPEHHIVSPDGRRVLLLSETSSTVLALPEKGPPTLVARSGHGVWRGGALWLSDARRVLLWEGEQGSLRCWDTAQNAESMVLNGIDSDIAGALPLGDGQRALTWSTDGNLQLWNLGSQQSPRPRTGHDRAVTAAEVVCGGGSALTCSEDESCRLWDLTTGQELMQLRVDSPDGIVSATPLQDERRVLLCTRMGRVYLADLSTGHMQRIVNQARVSADEEWHWAAIGGDTQILVSDDTLDPDRGDSVGRLMAQGKVALIFEKTIGYQRLLYLSPGGEAELNWQEDDVGHQYLPLDNDRLLVLTVRPIRSGEELVALEFAGWIHDLTKSAEQAIAVKFEPLRSVPESTIEGMLAVPGGKWALSWGNAAMLLAWRLDHPAQPIQLVGHESLVTGALALPDEQRALSWSHDGTLRLWALEDGRELAVLRCDAGAVEMALLLPGGRRAVSASWRVVCLWDLDAAAVLAAYHFDAEVTAMALHPDGSRVFVGDRAGRIQVLQVQHQH